MNNHLKITMIKGKQAPHYPAPEYEGEMEINQIVITEQGMQSGLPLVDFVLLDPRTGKKYLAVLTGRLVNAISAAIKGANIRNHGSEEP